MTISIVEQFNGEVDVSSILGGKRREKFSLFSSSFAEKGFVERLGTHLYFTIGKTRVIRIEGIIFCSFDHFAFEIFIFPCRRDRAL